MDDIFLNIELLLCCCTFCETYDEPNNNKHNNNNSNRENLLMTETSVTYLTNNDNLKKNEYIKRE